MWLRTLLECTHFEGCLVTFLCSLFLPCQFWGRIIDIYDTPSFVLSMQKQPMSIGRLLCTRIYVTIILMKFTWLFHLCFSLQDVIPRKYGKHHIIIFCKCLISEGHQSCKTFKIWSSSMLQKGIRTSLQRTGRGMNWLS
jgi:hypothetical protein